MRGYLMKIEVTKEKLKFKPIEIKMTIENETDLNIMIELFSEACENMPCPKDINGEGLRCEDCIIGTWQRVLDDC